jgi:hypothetical protein
LETYLNFGFTIHSEKKTEGKGRQYKEERGKKRERMQLKENGKVA